MLHIMFHSFFCQVHRRGQELDAGQWGAPVFSGSQVVTMGVFLICFKAKIWVYPLVNKQLDPENHLFLMEKKVFQPLSARVYVYLPEGNSFF